MFRAESVVGANKILLSTSSCVLWKFRILCAFPLIFRRNSGQCLRLPSPGECNRHSGPNSNLRTELVTSKRELRAVSSERPSVAPFRVARSSPLAAHRRQLNAFRLLHPEKDPAPAKADGCLQATG